MSAWSDEDQLTDAARSLGLRVERASDAEPCARRSSTARRFSFPDLESSSTSGWLAPWCPGRRLLHRGGPQLSSTPGPAVEPSVPPEAPRQMACGLGTLAAKLGPAPD